VNRSQERAKTRSKRTPRGAARAKRRGARVFKKPAVITTSICVGDKVEVDGVQYTVTTAVPIQSEEIAAALAELPGCPEHGVPACYTCIAEAVGPC